MSSDGTIGLERGRPLSQAAPLVVGLGYRAFRTVIRITHFPMASSRLTLFIAFPLSLLLGRPHRLPTSIIIGQPLYNAIIWGYHHISFISDRIFVTRSKELRWFSSTREEGTRRRGRCQEAVVPLTSHYTCRSLAAAKREGRKAPSRSLPLMKTSRFLAGPPSKTDIPQKGARNRGPRFPVLLTASLFGAVDLLTCDLALAETWQLLRIMQGLLPCDLALAKCLVPTQHAAPPSRCSPLREAPCFLMKNPCNALARSHEFWYHSTGCAKDGAIGNKCDDTRRRCICALRSLATATLQSYRMQLFRIRRSECTQS